MGGKESHLKPPTVNSEILSHQMDRKHSKQPTVHPHRWEEIACQKDKSKQSFEQRNIGAVSDVEDGKISRPGTETEYSQRT